MVNPLPSSSHCGRIFDLSRVSLPHFRSVHSVPLPPVKMIADIVGPPAPRRRRFLLTLAAFSFQMALSVQRTAAQTPSHAPRIVTLGVTATSLVASLGMLPAGAAPAHQYKAGKSDIHLPDSVMDIGQAFEPNYEVLQQLKPDLILATWGIPPDSPLRTIAPILTLPVTGASEDWFGEVAAALRRLGGVVHQSANADCAIDRTDVTLSVIRHHTTPQPIFLVNLDQDGLNLRVYGRHSLMDSVMRRVGVTNAFTSDDTLWGSQIVGLETLLAQPDAAVMHLPQYWEGAALMKKQLMRSPLWRALPQAAAGRVYTLDPIDIYGGLPSALRFATSMVAALGQEQKV